MNNKILFIIIDDEVKYLTNSNMDHREWYVSLGLDEDNFDNIVRGFIMDGKIVFFKGSNFNYDEEVIKCAKKYAKGMRLTLNNPNLVVCCGIVIASYGEKWEPIMTLTENDLDDVIVKEEVKKEEKTIPKEKRPLLEFNNNYEDPKFIKLAMIVTSIVLVLSIIIKIHLINIGRLNLSNGLDLILCAVQIGLLIYSLYGYKTKNKYTKYLSLISGICLFLMFDIFDIIIGILYCLFIIDINYFTKLIETIKKMGKKG